MTWVRLSEDYSGEWMATVWRMEGTSEEANKELKQKRAGLE